MYRGASACLIKDNRFAAAAEEEWFTRVKGQEGIPLHAARYCLNEGKIEPGDIDFLAVSQPENRFPFIRSNPRKLFRMLGMKDNFKKAGIQIIYVGYHLSHAANAFFTSPSSEAAIMTFGGVGDDAGYTFNYGKKKFVFPVKGHYMDRTHEDLYAASAMFLGFPSHPGESHLSDFSYYRRNTSNKYSRNNKYVKIFQRILHSTQYGISLEIPFPMHISKPYKTYPPSTLELLGEPREAYGFIQQRHKDIAAAVLVALEEAVSYLAKVLYRRISASDLCISGGVSSTVAPGPGTWKDSPFKNIYISPAAGNAGSALGAALEVYFSRSNISRERFGPFHSYIGPGFSEPEIQQAVESRQLIARREAGDNILKKVSQFLAEGKVVGWFQGRMEFGGQPLGNRGILADPRRKRIDIASNRITNTPLPQPLSLAVPHEEASLYFEEYHDAGYRTRMVRIRPPVRDLIPAAQDTSGIVRLHSVSREKNPWFYALLQHFQRETGLPILVNTPFCPPQEPIVRTPGEAVDCFLKTGMDALAIEHFLITGKHKGVIF